MSAPAASSSDAEVLLRQAMRLFVLKPTAAARHEGLRSLAKLRPSVLDRWNQPAEVSPVNGWTVLFDVMTAKEAEETSFREGRQVDAVQALLDAGIAVTMALPAFLAQPAFRSTNPHHERLFRFLLERTAEHAHANGRVVVPLLRQCTLPARCPDETWRKAIQRTCDHPTPQFTAQIAAAEAKHAKQEERKRKAEAAAEAEAEEAEEAEEADNDEDASADDADHVPFLPLIAKKKQKKAQPSSASGSAAAPASTLAELMQELESMVGMEKVAAQVKQLIHTQELDAARTKAGMSTPVITRHMVFTGSPGTGKTSVARILGKIYLAMGVLSKGSFSEVSIKDIQGAVVGATTKAMLKVVKEASGGVLFIDEAYALADPNSYGQEAIDVLIPVLENDRKDLVVIVAGYAAPMDKFMQLNDGMPRRFPHRIHFEDYTPPQMCHIFNTMAAGAQYTVTSEAQEKLRSIVSAEYERRADIYGYANAGDMRTMFENAHKSISARAPRPYPDPMTEAFKEQITTVLPGDIEPLVRCDASHASGVNEPRARGRTSRHRAK